MSYKEKQELEALPGRIDALEAASRDLHETMADPSFYQRDRAEIARVNARLEEVEEELARTFERWEALEAMAG